MVIGSQVRDLSSRGWFELWNMQKEVDVSSIDEIECIPCSMIKMIAEKVLTSASTIIMFISSAAWVGVASQILYAHLSFKVMKKSREMILETKRWTGE